MVFHRSHPTATHGHGALNYKGTDSLGIEPRSAGFFETSPKPARISSTLRAQQIYIIASLLLIFPADDIICMKSNALKAALSLMPSWRHIITDENPIYDLRRLSHVAHE